MESPRPLCRGSGEETVNTISLSYLALIEVTAMFLAGTSAGIADASSPLERDGYIHPSLAADGVSWDDAALAKARAEPYRSGVRREKP